MSSNHGQIQYKDAAGGIGSARAAGSSALRLVSYNIHAAVGTDGRRDIDRIAAVIQEIDPDIIALQEVESRRARGGIDQARLIASALDMSLVEGPILEDGHGWYGNAILSKRAGFDVEHWRYPQHSGEPRAALAMRFADAEDQPWRIVATHLDLRFRPRRHQVETLVRTLADDASERLVLLADLNEWWPWSPSWQRLKTLGDVPAGAPSFPSWCPLLRLDRAVLHHCRMLKPLRAHITTLSRRASDHLPIVLEVAAEGIACGQS
jgi:endonuclease/exonuclease/phosphatase family metal-dependent hydrolase